MAKILIGVIGAGGKTTALSSIALECAHQSVLISTTTHMFPMKPWECKTCLTDPSAGELRVALSQAGIVCAGSRSGEGKIRQLPPEVLQQGIEMADVFVYEGDGAHRLPLKLHRPGEPVILPDTDRCLIVAGLSALGHPVEKVIHRFERNPIWKENPGHPVDTEDILYCILETAEASQIPYSHIRVLLNQSDTLSDRKTVQNLMQKLHMHGLSVRLESLQAGCESLFPWITEGECP